MILFAMLLIPILVALGFFIFSGRKITVLEFLGQNVAQVLVMSCFLAATSCSNTADVEVWNGRVTSKNSQRVSCSHSYPCNCRTVCSGGKHRTCSTRCQTCHLHAFDIDWLVKTSNGEVITIGRVNLQGTQEPPRWTAVQIGEPTAVTHSYENYVKASPDSLFRKQGLVEKYQKEIPAYPGNIFDYYRLNRLVTVGTLVSDVEAWNKSLSELNATIGHKKQVNIVVVVTKNKPEEYFFALEQAWIGAKKNDVVAVIDVGADGTTISRVNVMAWTNNKMAEVVIRDEIMKIGTLDREAILKSIGNSVETYYVRKPMKDFEYLKNTMTPTFGQWVMALIIGLLISVGLGIMFMRNDIQQ